MPVFRTEKVSDYAVIAKHHLKNKALSYKAKGLLTFMLSVPPEWDWSMAGLSTLASDGIDGVRSGIRELEKHGYLSRRRIRDSSGKLGDIEYTIHEIPQSPQSDSPILEKPILEKPILAKPMLENPIQVLPTQVFPTQENPMQINNNQSSINELNTKELSNNKQLSADDKANPHQKAECLRVQTAQGTEESVNHTMTFFEQQFEQFWQLYPRKAGKKAAKKAWMDIKPSDTLFSTIITAVKEANQYWQQQGTLQKHIPHPSTWLNEERWEDEYPVSQHNLIKTGGNQNAIIGTHYTIGGDDDPYREIMSK